MHRLGIEHLDLPHFYVSSSRLDGEGVLHLRTVDLEKTREILGTFPNYLARSDLFSIY